MELTLTPEVEALLQHELQSGKFGSPNEVLETALHVLSDSRGADRADWNAVIAEGIDSDDAGDVYSEDEARAFIQAYRAKLA